MAPSDIPFTANPAERLIEPQAPALPTRSRLAPALLGACLIHASVLSILLFEAWRESAVVSETLETPVEIIVEPPPQEKPVPPPQEKQEAPPPARSTDDEPATDAPRAANKEKIERDAPDQASKAPPASTAAQQPQPGLSPEQAPGQKQEGELRGAENSAAPAPDRPDAEVIAAPAPDRDQAEQRQARADAQAQSDILNAFGGEPFPAWSIGHPSAFDALPELELAGAAEDVPIAGGKARATYLSIIYGLVMAHMHSPTIQRQNLSKIEGVIVFTVDSRGALVEHKIAHPSGFREFDAAALAAVVEAAPFPKPPGRAPIGLRFTFGAK